MLSDITPLPHSPFAILLTYDRRLNKYEPFSDTETTALLFPPPAEERYPRIPLHVSYHQDMEIATLIWFQFEHPVKKKIKNITIVKKFFLSTLKWINIKKLKIAYYT